METKVIFPGRAILGEYWVARVYLIWISNGTVISYSQGHHLKTTISPQQNGNKYLWKKQRACTNKQVHTSWLIALVSSPNDRR